MLSAEFFHSDTVHERAVELFDGSKHTLFFRELTDAEYRKVQRAGRDEDPETRESHRTMMIAMSLCSAAGAPELTFEQADSLKPVVKDRLYLSALEVNGFAAGGKPAAPGNALPPGATTGSGTSSPSHSEDVPSESGSA